MSELEEKRKQQGLQTQAWYGEGEIDSAAGKVSGEGAVRRISQPVGGQGLLDRRSAGGSIDAGNIGGGQAPVIGTRADVFGDAVQFQTPLPFDPAVVLAADCSALNANASAGAGPGGVALGLGASALECGLGAQRVDPSSGNDFGFRVSAEAGGAGGDWFMGNCGNPDSDAWDSFCFKGSFDVGAGVGIDISTENPLGLAGACGVGAAASMFTPLTPIGGCAIGVGAQALSGLAGYESVGDAVSEAGAALYEGSRTLASDAWDAGAQRAQTGWRTGSDWAEERWDQTTAATKDAWHAGKDWTGQTWSATSEAAQDAWQGAKTWGQGTWQSAEQSAAAAVDSGVAHLQKGGKWVSDNAEDGWAALQELFGGRKKGQRGQRTS